MTDERPAGVEVPPSPGKKSRVGVWIAAGIVGAAIVAGSIAIPISISNAEKEAAAEAKAAAEREAAAEESARLAQFSDALGTCDVQRSDYVTILDLGEALNMTAVGKLYGPSLEGLFCILGEIDAPSSLESKIGATRALDGVQNEEWDGFEIEWRYHPDDGATVTIEHAG